MKYERSKEGLPKIELRPLVPEEDVKLVRLATCEALGTAIMAVVRKSKVAFSVHEGDFADWENIDIKQLKRSSPFLTGEVKWDGCSNWELSQGAYYHSCGKKGLIAVGATMNFCYDWAFELCPDWEKDDDFDVSIDVEYNVWAVN